jgi:hypothetical protein
MPQKEFPLPSRERVRRLGERSWVRGPRRQARSA